MGASVWVSRLPDAGEGLMAKELPRKTGQLFQYGLIFNRYAPVIGLK